MEATAAQPRVGDEPVDTGDPRQKIDDRKAARAAPEVRTFRQDADAFLEIYSAKKNLKPSATLTWDKCIAREPELMAKPVAAVTEADILGTLEGRPDSTKRRIFWMLGRVLAWSRAQGHIAVNPVDYMLDDKIPLAPVDKNKHLASMPWADVPAFMASLREDNSLASLCVQWIILTACRNMEGRDARFDEIVTLQNSPLDGKDKSIWVIPAERMKESVEHVVPLSPQAMDVLEKIRQLRWNGPRLFPAPRKFDAPLSDKSIQKLIPEDVTLHGFRSSFADWANAHGFSIPLIDTALSHVVGGQITRTYVRGTLVPERRPMMTAWASFLDTETDHDAHVCDFWRQERAASSEILGKCEFAAMVGLSRSTLSMMLKRGAIGGAALVGEGQKARINVEIAKEQLRKLRRK